jgi:hypothetical protein
MTPPTRSLLAGLAALALGLATPARADVVTLADGRVLEGSVRHEGATVIIRHKLGEVRVDAGQVVKIVETEDPWDELERLRGELSRGTADERYRFAVFCREHGFDDEARRAFLDVLRVDSDHPGARAALGYVRDEGRWVTLEDHNRALGLVLDHGEWVTPEVKAKRAEDERQAALARQAAREAELAQARARREQERAEARQARREQALAYAREVARQEAIARIDASSPYTGNGVLASSWYGAGVYVGPGTYLRVITTPWGNGFAPPCPTVVTGHRRYRSSGSGVSGSYRDGHWSLSWRLGF